MRNVIIVLLLFFLSSCMTVKRIKKNCDKFVPICVVEKEVVTTISYRDTIIYKLDTVFVPLPKDTVTLIKTVTVREDNLAYLAEVHKEFGLIGVDASVYRSILRVNAYLNDSTILYVEPDTVYLEKAIKIELTEDTNYVEVVPNGIKWMLGICIFLLVFGIIFVIYLIKNKKL